MVEDRMPKLVQVGDKVEIGNSGKHITTDTTNLTFVDDSDNLCDVKTGNLTVDGNLNVTNGHITEFDVGTAVFKDKTLELGASTTIVENMADGAGIVAVNSLQDMRVNISGLNTDTVTITMTTSDFLESRQLVIGTASNNLQYDIASASSYNDIKKIVDSDSLFSTLFTCTVNSSNIEFSSIGGDNITTCQINKFVGPSVLYSSDKTGWVFDDKVCLSNTGIDATVDSTNKSDFTIMTAEPGVVKVREGYEENVVDANTLITKRYAEMNFLSSDNLSPGLPDKGVEFISGYISVNTSQNGNNGFVTADAMTIVFPWMTISSEPEDDSMGILQLNGTNFSISVYVLTYPTRTITIRTYVSGSAQQSATFAIGESTVIRPIFCFDADQGLVHFFLNDVEVGSSEFTLDDNNITSLTLGYSTTSGIKYNGIMSGEFIILNYDASEEVKLRCNTNVWAPYSSQWGTFEYTNKGTLYEGHTYEIKFGGSYDFTACGIYGSTDGDYLCTKTAEPVWGTSTARMLGCTMMLLLTRRLALDVDVLDMAHGRNGTFEGLIYYNNVIPDVVGIQKYL